MFDSVVFQSVVGTMEKSAKALIDFKDTVITATEDVNDSIVGPLCESVKGLNEAVGIYDDAKNFVFATVKDFSGEITIDSLQKAFDNFDHNWDDFAIKVYALYQRLPQSVQNRIYEDFVSSLFNSNIFNAGSVIKNELPGLLAEISKIKDVSTSLKDLNGNTIYNAIKIKKGIDSILGATKKIYESLDKMTGNNFSAIVNRLTTDSKILNVTRTAITDILQTVNTKFYKPVSEIVDMAERGLFIYDSAKITVDALTHDLSGHVTVESLASATQRLNANYDKFAQNVNDLYHQLHPNDQNDILETFAKACFGDNVFNAGSAIKNNVPGVLSGIVDFNKSIDQFGGHYDSPEVAINKIKNGVQGIVAATEKIAHSLNEIYKGVRKDDKVGLPVLNSLSKLHENKYIKPLNTALQATSDVTAVVMAIRDINEVVKLKDPKLLQRSLENLRMRLEALSKYKSSESNDDKEDRNKDDKDQDTDEKEKQDNIQDTTQKQNKSPNTKGVTYVTSTATLRCPYGDRLSSLTVYPDRTASLSKTPEANISDHISNYNIAPFGKCRSLAFPATAAATAAAHGRLTPMPCIPNTPVPWIGGKPDYLIKGQPALLKSCTCPCMWGGTISIVDDGQTVNINEDKANVPDKGSKNETLENTIDLYIGIFFDGTNNNKYQTMLGKKFRRDQILQDIVKKANGGDYNESQLTSLINAGIIQVGTKWMGLKKNYKAAVSSDQLIKGRSRDWWESIGVLTQSQLDMLYFGYASQSGSTTNDDTGFIEAHIKQTLDMASSSDENVKALSSLPTEDRENELLRTVAASFSENQDAKDKNKVASDNSTSDDMESALDAAEGSFAQGATYTNVAILESLYNTKKDTETEFHYSIYVEGSGADTIILPKIDKVEALVCDVIGLFLKNKTKDFTQKDIGGMSLSDIAKIFSGQDLASIIDSGIDYVMAQTAQLATGLKNMTREVVGLGFGVGKTGVVAKTRTASLMVKNIINKYNQTNVNLHFDLFGFSRGATTARVFNYAIDPNKDKKMENGGLMKINPNDFEMIMGTNNNYLEIGSRNPRLKSKEVRFMGIYDTVSSIGVFHNDGTLENVIGGILKNLYEEFNGYKKSIYHEHNVSDFGLYDTNQAQNVVHICALDEVRQNFALVDIESSIQSGNGKEIFIPGCHTDIGGGAAIGREGEKIVNVKSIDGVDNYICKSSATSGSELRLLPVSADSLVELGWLSAEQETKKKTISGRVSSYVLQNTQDTVYSDNSANPLTRNNIIMYRYVKPGYSNISLHLMKDEVPSFFKNIPLSYDIPKDLQDYYGSIKGFVSQNGRTIISPDIESYYCLRSSYLHYSSNDQLMSAADNMVVNPPNYVTSCITGGGKGQVELIGNEVTANAWRSYKSAKTDAGDCMRFSSRIIYPGTSDVSSTPQYMFDYQDGGKAVKCRTLLREHKNRLQQNLHEVQQRIDMISQTMKTPGLPTMEFLALHEILTNLNTKEKELNNKIKRVRQAIG